MRKGRQTWTRQVERSFVTHGEKQAMHGKALDTDKKIGKSGHTR